MNQKSLRFCSIFELSNISYALDAKEMCHQLIHSIYRRFKLIYD